MSHPTATDADLQDPPCPPPVKDVEEELIEEVHMHAQQQHEEEELGQCNCGVLSRYPVLSVVTFAVLGIGIGVGLSFWEPEDPTQKEVALKWLGLVGDLFIRALKCVVLPLVFVNVCISVIEMMSVGKASSIGWKTIGFYFLTTIMASIFGIISSLIFKGLYKVGTPEPPPVATVTFGCVNEGEYIVEGEDGNVFCAANYTTEDPNAQFTIAGGSLVTASSGPAEVSLSDTVYSGVFTKIVTDNFVAAFADANFAAVVFFAIAFGVALSQVIDHRQRTCHDKGIVIQFFREIDSILIIMINWIIAVTPFAVLSLIMKAVGGQNDLADAFSNIGFLMVATIVAMIMQVLIVYVGLYFLITKTNPFRYLKFIIPAQTMAFASSSSAATIPMSIKSVLSTGVVPDAIARFVVPLGATVNMDGGAIYFPCACIWLAILNGIQPGVSDYILLVVVATIGSAGTAPVPSASLVLIITAYNTVFNTTGVPYGFSFIFAVDWFMDRLRTVTNVTGDTVVTGIVSHLSEVDDVTLHGDDEESNKAAALAAAKSSHTKVMSSHNSDDGTGSDKDIDC